MIAPCSPTICLKASNCVLNFSPTFSVTVAILPVMLTDSPSSEELISDVAVFHEIEDSFAAAAPAPPTALAFFAACSYSRTISLTLARDSARACCAAWLPW